MTDMKRIKEVINGICFGDSLFHEYYLHIIRFAFEDKIILIFPPKYARKSITDGPVQQAFNSANHSSESA